MNTDADATIALMTPGAEPIELAYYATTQQNSGWRSLARPIAVALLILEIAYPLTLADGFLPFMGGREVRLLLLYCVPLVSVAWLLRAIVIHRRIASANGAGQTVWRRAIRLSLIVLLACLFVTFATSLYRFFPTWSYLIGGMNLILARVSSTVANLAWLLLFLLFRRALLEEEEMSQRMAQRLSRLFIVCAACSAVWVARVQLNWIVRSYSYQGGQVVFIHDTLWRGIFLCSLALLTIQFVVRFALAVSLLRHARQSRSIHQPEIA